MRADRGSAMRCVKVGARRPFTRLGMTSTTMAVVSSMSPLFLMASVTALMAALSAGCFRMPSTTGPYESKASHTPSDPSTIRAPAVRRTNSRG